MKTIFDILGVFFLLVGLIGAVLPVMPTTPFILLAMIFFMKSQGRLYNYLLKYKFVRNVLAKASVKDISVKKRLLILLGAWAILVLVFLKTDNLIVKYLVLVAGIVKTNVFLVFPVIARNYRRQKNRFVPNIEPSEKSPQTNKGNQRTISSHSRNA